MYTLSNARFFLIMNIQLSPCSRKREREKQSKNPIVTIFIYKYIYLCGRSRIFKLVKKEAFRTHGKLTGRKKLL
jgi:hypothetical protein